MQFSQSPAWVLPTTLGDTINVMFKLKGAHAGDVSVSHHPDCN